MFPFDVDDEIYEAEAPKEYIDYEIDFKTGTLTGKMVSGVDAIVQAIKLAISTDRYTYSQYSWEYGSELNTLIGKSYSQDYVNSEVRRMIEDVVQGYEDVISISDIQSNLSGGKLTASFRIDTVYGGAEISV